MANREHPPRPSGLKPTLRQLMIVTLWAALVLAAARVLIGLGLLGNSPEIVLMVVPLIVASWPMPILIGLIWAFDRPGPLRAWYCSVTMVAWAAISGVAFLLQDPACFFLFGYPTATFPMGAFLGPLCLWSCWKQWQVVRPGLCVRCDRRAVIPWYSPPVAQGRDSLVEARVARCAICGSVHPLDEASDESWPRRCVRCGHPTVARPGTRARGTYRQRLELLRFGWCAGCGFRYEREGPKAWSPILAEG